MSADTNPFPHASELRDKLNKAKSHAAEAQIHALLTKISQAIEQGRSEIQVGSFEPGVKRLLEDRGYVLMHMPGYDQRDTEYYLVSW
jgi:hypothetical protein